MGATIYIFFSFFSFCECASVCLFVCFCLYSFAFTICPRVLSVRCFIIIIFFSIAFSTSYHWWIYFLVWCLSSFFLFLNYILIFLFLIITFLYFILVTLFYFNLSFFLSSFLPSFFPSFLPSLPSFLSPFSSEPCG